MSGRATCMPAGRDRPRGFVMVAVLVIVSAAILVATGAIFAARAAVASSRAADFDRRLRDAALDGVALAADALARDRERLLAGGVPTADELLAEIPDGGRRIEVRLVPQPGGALFASESSKLDANAASAESLARLTEPSSELARAIVASAAGRRPLPSIDGAAAYAPRSRAEDALREVLGPLRAVGEERESVEDSRGAAAEDESPPLVSLLTVHGAEPLVDPAGRPRLDLVAAFGDGAASEQSTASISAFEDAERDVLEAVARKAGSNDDDGAIARALIERGVDLARVDAILATCTIQAGTHGKPRVDIVHAHQRVLAALDGIGPEIATRIVDLRDSLDEDERRGTSWLVARRVLTPEQYGAVAGRITGRSALWRFRVESRVVTDEERDGESAGSPGTEPRGACAFDCVVDVSAESGRIAFLRDVSMLTTARVLAHAARSAEGDDETPKTRSSAPVASDDGGGLDDGPDDGLGDSLGDSLGDAPNGAEDGNPPETSRLDGGTHFSRPLEPVVSPREGTAPERAPRGRISPTGRDIGGSR